MAGDPVVSTYNCNSRFPSNVKRILSALQRIIAFSALDYLVLIYIICQEVLCIITVNLSLNIQRNLEKVIIIRQMTVHNVNEYMCQLIMCAILYVTFER